MKRDLEETPMHNFVERKCKDCGQTYEVRIDMQNTLYGDYCCDCFFANVRLYVDGSMERKEKEKIDTSYKDELQGVTHRGKHRCE
jgi:hypothetical protein